MAKGNADLHTFRKLKERLVEVTEKLRNVEAELAEVKQQTPDKPARDDRWGTKWDEDDADDRDWEISDKKE